MENIKQGDIVYGWWREVDKPARKKGTYVCWDNEQRLHIVRILSNYLPFAEVELIKPKENELYY